jgi:hypothetical protein
VRVLIILELWFDIKVVLLALPGTERGENTFRQRQLSLTSRGKRETEMQIVQD